MEINDNLTQEFDSDASQLQRMEILKCPVSGIGFHNIFDIWDELYVGAKIALVRDKNNQYDENAVAVALEGDYDGDPDEFDFDFILGYIPRIYNQTIASLLDSGCERQIEAEISELKEYGPLNNRLHITVYFLSKDPIPPKGDSLYILDFTDEDWASLQDEILHKGYTYQRWPIFLPDAKFLPEPGDKIVFINQQEDYSNIYLMMTLTKGNKSLQYLIHNEKTDYCDDCTPYVLTVIKGDIIIRNEKLPFIGTLQHAPHHQLHQLNKEKSDILLNLFID